MGAQHRLQGAGELGRARDRLQYDGDSGLRNPFLCAGRRGRSAETATVDGKPIDSIDPTTPRTPSRCPSSGILVPLPGVADDAKNQCDFAPCTLSEAHRTITVHIPHGKKGRYRWQCFVPCAAGFITGFGGPMQTIGYMDGFLNVV